MLLLLPIAWAQNAASTKKDKPDTIRDPALKPDKIAERIAKWPECDEYKSAERCMVTIYLGKAPQPDSDAGPWMPHAHWDVQVKPFIFLSERPRGEAAVMLRQSSPFNAMYGCCYAGSPYAGSQYEYRNGIDGARSDRRGAGGQVLDNNARGSASGHG
jgi:hypothetical protein